jgi:L-lactate dehydrogenase complex protein LldF
MNTCPVYRRSGGYSYTYFIPGPIGINLGMLKAPLHYYDNVSACSLCYSCSNVCPAKVDLAEQIYLWRQDLNKMGVANQTKKLMSNGMEILMNRPKLFNTTLKMAPMGMGILKSVGLQWGKGRDYPTFPKESFNEMWKKGKVK